MYMYEYHIKRLSLVGFPLTPAYSLISYGNTMFGLWLSDYIWILRTQLGHKNGLPILILFFP